MGSRPALFTKMGALDSQPQMIKFTRFLPMVGGSLRVLWLLPPLKLVAMILLKAALNTKKKEEKDTLIIALNCFISCR